MKPYYLLLVFLLLLLFMPGTVLNVYAEIVRIGPGVDYDNENVEWYYFGPEVYDMYPFGDIYIEFNITVNATYTFFIVWATYEEYSEGYIQFELTDKDNNYIKDVTITFNARVPAHVEELFSVHLDKGTYRLWIHPHFVSGSLMLSSVPSETDPSISMYNHPQHGWMQLRDLQWEAQYDSEAPDTEVSYPQPQAVYDPNEIWSDQDYVYVPIIIWNWKNGTNITIMRYDEITNTYTDKQVFTVENIDKQKIIAKFKRVNGGEYGGDYILVVGKDLYDNTYSVRLQEFNKTIVPKSWFGTVSEWFNTLYQYASNIFFVVVTVLPYAGAMWAVAFMGSIIKCIHETSLNPLFDFLYKNYSLLTSLASLTLKIIEKMSDALKYIGSLITKVVLLLAG